MIHGMLWVLPLVREGPPSALFENSRNLASSSRGLRLDTTGNTMRPEKELRREPQESSAPVPRFQEELEVITILVELTLTVS